MDTLGTGLLSSVESYLRASYLATPLNYEAAKMQKLNQQSHADTLNG